ncbi:MAG: hypothetical protein QF833_00070 [Alphaproteobacteria bacterium]|nr:hypothetical protein [Alphaproteobacteria bacterium]
MFGLSFSEILLIAIPLVFLWIHMKRSRDEDERQAGPASAPPPSRHEAKDMMACAVCGVYRPAESHEPCEREDCPFFKPV